MIKQAYFRGLMKVAQATKKQLSQSEKDKTLTGGIEIGLPGERLKTHGFYKDTPIGRVYSGHTRYITPQELRQSQAVDSALKFGNMYDSVYDTLLNYYQNIGRQNRDFYLKQGFRPPKGHKYKTPFPYPNHPKKKQMMFQNQWQANNNRGQKYKGHA